MAEFITMAGVDHSTASLEIRERFAFTKSAAQAAMRTALSKPGITGCILLSTCNRTELWLTAECPVDSSALLCALRGVEPVGAQAFLSRRAGHAAQIHLMETACGLHSRVFGEDQIITQVNAALCAARECGCAGPVLERLFRAAVTAAKRVKTSVRLTARDASAPARAAAVLEHEWGGTLSGAQCLIIGNGQMGRLAAKELLARGCRVGMTLRSHHHGGGGDIPAGCAVIPYEERYAALKKAHIVVSATSSPHHTLHYADTLPYLDGTRRVFIDLAVPRDISVRIAGAPGVTLYDIDSLSTGQRPGGSAASQFRAEAGGKDGAVNLAVASSRSGSAADAETTGQRVEKARAILEQELAEFEAWLGFRGLEATAQATGTAAAQELCKRLEKTLCRLVPPEHRAELEAAVFQSAAQITARLAYGMRGLPEDTANEAVGRLLCAAQKHPAQYALCCEKKENMV